MGHGQRQTEGAERDQEPEPDRDDAARTIAADAGAERAAAADLKVVGLRVR